jgi:integrase
VFEIAAQSKTATPLRIRVEGEFGALIERIAQRKKGYKVWSAHLAINLHGMPLTKQVLRKHFEAARNAAALAHPDLAAEIRAMWFYDLRAKAADDVSDDRGDQAAADLLGHETVSTTRRHYLRRGKIVGPTK